MTVTTLQDVADLFVPVPNFPEEGILFWNVGDVTTHPVAYKLVLNELEMRCRQWEAATGKTIDYIGGFDARGFIFGGVVADRLGVGFLQIRKKGKLPPPTESISYTMEYGGEKILEMNLINLSGKVVVLVDDLLATGGTAKAGCHLIEKMGGTVGFFLTVTELPLLQGRALLQDYEVATLLTEIEQKLKAHVRYCIDAIITDRNTGDLVLIERLSIPAGYAMPGGGIELGESALKALVREVEEETGCMVHIGSYKHHMVLTGADRDPRGDQVSLVFKVTIETKHARGEEGKTLIYRIPQEIHRVPGPHLFAFLDHAEVVYKAVEQAAA